MPSGKVIQLFKNADERGSANPSEPSDSKSYFDEMIAQNDRNAKKRRASRLTKNRQVLKDYKIKRRFES